MLSGIGNDHNSSAHQVTSCLHEHAQTKDKVGGADMTSMSAARQLLQTEEQQQGQLSLSAWMERMLGKGRSLLRNIWGGNETAATGEAGDRTGQAQVLAQIREPSDLDSLGASSAGQNTRRPDMPQALHTSQIAAAATAVNQPQTVQNNPYFSAVEDTGRQQENLWQKVKVKFNSIAGQLAGHLPGKAFNFQTRSSFQARKERSKEDLRKRSKFRKDEVEIDCVLTDDSYLMDSYDRKGEYSTLSTRK